MFVNIFISRVSAPFCLKLSSENKEFILNETSCVLINSSKTNNRPTYLQQTVSAHISSVSVHLCSRLKEIMQRNGEHTTVCTSNTKHATCTAPTFQLCMRELRGLVISFQFDFMYGTLPKDIGLFQTIHPRTLLTLTLHGHTDFCNQYGTRVVFDPTCF